MFLKSKLHVINEIICTTYTNKCKWHAVNCEPVIVLNYESFTIWECTIIQHSQQCNHFWHVLGL